MAYIGRDIEYGVLEKQTLTADSSTVAFDLTYISDANGLIVSVGGIVQEPNVAYTVIGSTLTFTEAPTTGDTVYVVYLGQEMVVSTITPTDYMDYQVGTGDGSDTTPITTLNHSVSLAQDIMVTLNGIRQVPSTDYSVSGTTLTFTTAPADGVAILVYFLMLVRAEGTVVDNSVTDAKIVGMSGSKITTGTVPAGAVSNASIIGMDAAKLTGSFPESMGADLSLSYQRLATLGLHVQNVNNKVAFNLTNSFLDSFEDDSGILTETDVDRDATGEYISSVGTTIYGTQHTVTVVNNTQHTTAFSKFGTSAIAFDGTNDELNVANHSDFTFGSANYTIDFWLRTNGSGNSYAWALFNRGASSSQLWWLGNNGSQLSINVFTSGGTINLRGGPNLADTLWHHVAMVRNGNVWTSYVDGTQVATQTLAGTVNADTNPFRIGHFNGSAGVGDFNGNMDDFRISNTALWTTAFSVPTVRAVPDANTKLLIQSDNQTNGSASFTDNNSVISVSATGSLVSTSSTADSAVSEVTGALLVKDSVGTNTLGTDLKAYFSSDNGSNWTEAASYDSSFTFDGTTKVIPLGKTTLSNTGTAVKMKVEWANQVATLPATGTTKVISPIGDANFSSSQVKIGNSSISFDGTGDYLSVADHDDWAFSGDFTIEFWIKPNVSSGNQGMLGQSGSGSWGGIGILAEMNGTGRPLFQIGNNGSTGISVSVATPLTDGSWHHVAFVRSGNTFNLYVDGVSGANTTSSLTIQNRSESFYIGKQHTNGNILDGYMDEIRFSDTARYTADFTPSTTAFTTDANTKLLIHSNESSESTTFTDSSSNAHTVTAYGDTKHQPPIKKIGTSSLLFDGTGDRLTIPDNADFDFSGDFTAELWMYNTVSNSGAHLIGNVNHSTGGGGGWSIYCNGTGIIKFNDYGNGISTTNFNVGWSANTWHHVCVTKESGTIKLWFDGQLKTSVSHTSAITSSNDMGIGSDGVVASMYYNGYMDEIRISDVARYTANFTPSTTAFTTDANTKLLIHGDSSNPEGDSITDSSRAPEVIGKVAQLHGWAVNY